MPIPSLQMYPSGFKATKLYSQLPTDGTGDFTHARSTTATRINSIGVVETVAIDVPRLDYTDDVCPVLLLEPQSTNLYLNSAVMVTQGVTTTATPYTVSFYGTGTITFTGTHSGSLVGTGANDRVSVTFTPSAGTLTSTISGTVTNGQVENLSYATSVIVTLGSTVTRTADICNDAGDVNTFNSVEGVLFVEMAALVNDLSTREISISDASFNNRIEIRYLSVSNQIQAVVRVASVVVAAMIFNSSDITSFDKVALKWKVNDFAFWANGVEVATDGSGVSFPASTLTETAFDDGGGFGNFFGKVKEIRVYKTALTDLELQTLTT